MKSLKKLTYILASVLMAAALFTGCADLNGAGNSDKANRESKTAVVRIQAVEVSRTINPEIGITDFTSYVLKGTLSGGTEQTLGSWETSDDLSEAEVEIATGSWSFTLTASKDRTVYSNTISATVTTQSSVLAFNLSVVSYDFITSSNPGSIEVSLKVPEEVVAVKAGLYTMSSTGFETAVTGYADELMSLGSDDTVCYEKTGVPGGSYILYFKLYADEACENVSGVYREVINVANGFTSKAEREVESVNALYTITYNFNSGSLKDGETARGSYTRYADEIQLPGNDEMVNGTKTFDGWFTDEDLTQSFGSSIPSGSTGNVVLYAKWTQYRTLSFAGELQLPAIRYVDGESVSASDIPASEDKEDYSIVVESVKNGDADFTAGHVMTEDIEVTVTGYFYCTYDKISSVYNDLTAGTFKVKIKDGVTDRTNWLSVRSVLAGTKAGTNVILDLSEGFELTGDYTSGWNDSSAKITGYTASSVVSIILPDSFTELKSYDLSYFPSIKKLTIPDVTQIGSAALSGCGGLEEINLPFTGATININANSAGSECLGYIFGSSSYENSTRCYQYYTLNYSNAFYIPSNLSKVTVRGGKLEYGAYYNCTMVKELHIESAVSKIGGKCFYGCNLESFYFPSVTDWLSCSFTDEYCSPKTSLYFAGTPVTDLVIPEGITSIPAYAFYGDTLLESVSIPENLASIGNYAFKNCTNLNTVYVDSLTTWLNVTLSNEYSSPVCSSPDAHLYEGEDEVINLVIPDGVTVIKDYAFKGFGDIESVTFNNTLTSLGMYAFCDLNKLTEINITSPVTAINSFCFKGCNSLKKIVLPETVIFIGTYALYDCYSLEEIQAPCFGGASNYSSPVTYGQLYNLFYNSSSLDADKIIAVSGKGVPKNLKKVVHNGSIVAGSQFSGCTMVEEVVLTKATSIGTKAFYNCTGLKEISLPGTLTSIDSCAFQNCSSLTELVIPSSVTSFNYSLPGCSALEELTIPSLPTTLAKLFSTSISNNGSIPSSLKKLTVGGSNFAASAFSSVRSLETLVINSDSITKFETSAFYNTEVKNLYLPSLEVLLNSEYVYNTSTPFNATAEKIYIDGVELGSSITIPSGTTSIPSYIFANASGLTTISIPSTVTSIGSDAFKNGQNFTSVYIEDLDAWESIDMGSETSTPAASGATLYVNGTAVTELTLSTEVNVVKPYVFSNFSFTKLTIPDNVTEIGTKAFANSRSFTTLTIPSTVTTIGAGAFTAGSSLKEITLPFAGGSAAAETSDTTTGFGYIFTATPSSLNKITITGGKILENTFYNLSGMALDEVKFTGNVSTVCTGAIYDSLNTKSLYIDTCVTEIQQNAIGYCSKIEKLTLPFVGTSADAEESTNETLEYITSSNITSSSYSKLKTVVVLGGNLKAAAFKDCKTLTGITLPATVTTIPAETFSGCTSLVSMAISNNVTEIGAGAFYNCTSLTELTLPFTGSTANPAAASESTLFGYIFGTTASGATVQYYSETDSVQYNIPSKLKKVTITGGKILYGTFNGCNSLTEINLSNITSIGDVAFKGCSGITSISLPESVTEIGKNILESCNSLKEMVVPFVGSGTASEDPGDHVMGYFFRELSSGESLSTSWKKVTHNLEGVSARNYVMPSALIKVTVLNGPLAYGAFSGMNIQSCILPENLTEIPSYLFNGCGNLEEIHLPETVTAIGQYAFNNCSKLTTVDSCENITTIGRNAFYSCSSLTSVGSCENVTSFGISVFGGCSKLTHVDLSDSLTEIPSGMFSYSGLSDFTMPAGVTSIGDGVFEHCSNLTEVPDLTNVTTIGSAVFYYCTGLTEVEINKEFTSLGTRIFERCSGITSIKWSHNAIPEKTFSYGYSGSDAFVVELGENVTSIGNYAFEYTKITGINLPEGLTSIGSHAFSNTKLTEVIMPDTVTSIGQGSFYYCQALTTVKLSSKLTEIPGVCFFKNTSLKAVSIPSKVTKIGSRAFWGSNSSITITFEGATATWNGFFESGGYTYKPTFTTTETYRIRTLLVTISDSAGECYCVYTKQK